MTLLDYNYHKKGLCGHKMELGCYKSENAFLVLSPFFDFFENLVIHTSMTHIFLFQVLWNERYCICCINQSLACFLGISKIGEISEIQAQISHLANENDKDYILFK